MNTSINHCEDFYHYSCGGWINKKNNYMYRRNNNNWTELKEKIDEILVNDVIDLLKKTKN